MIHDQQSLESALDATIELLPEYDTEIFRFHDSRVRYEIHLQPRTATAFIAMDPTEPIQACPMLEFSFRCSDIVIGKSAYSADGNDVAIRFYDGDVSDAGLRLTMTWIPEGYWYILANANDKPYSENVE